MKKKFIFESKKLLHTNSIIRTRIVEDRNLSKGLRLNRNERVLNFSKNLLSNIFKKVKGYDLAKYPDQKLIYKHLETFLLFGKKLQKLLYLILIHDFPLFQFLF